MDEVAAGSWGLDEDGALTIPDEPGLGLGLDPEAVARYPGGRDLLEP
jgi:D-galactarolactone cycloisomerase